MHSSLKFSRFKVPEENVVKREGETERDRERQREKAILLQSAWK